MSKPIKKTETPNGVSNTSKNNEQAQIALRWIFALAQLKHNYKITLDDMTLNAIEASHFITGKKTLEDIKADRELIRTDFKAYMNKEFKDHKKAQNSHFPASRNLPSMNTNPLIRDHINYEIQGFARKREMEDFDIWYKVRFTDESDWEKEQKLSPEELATKRQKQATEHLEKTKNYGLKDLEPHSKVIWIMQARKAYEDGTLTIKTQNGEVLPAWQKIEILDKDGNVTNKNTVNNTAKSVDNKFYDENGEHLYSLEKTTNSIINERSDEIQFTMGTPKISDISEETLVLVINEFLTSQSNESPLLTHTVASNAAALLKGLRAPNLNEEALKNEFKWKTKVPDSGPMATDEEVNKKLEQFTKALKEFKNKTDQSPQLDDNTLE